jgi:hypothetical protein
MRLYTSPRTPAEGAKRTRRVTFAPTGLPSVSARTPALCGAPAARPSPAGLAGAMAAGKGLYDLSGRQVEGSTLAPWVAPADRLAPSDGGNGPRALDSTAPALV